jgi:hypothetical protein
MPKTPASSVGVNPRGSSTSAIPSSLGDDPVAYSSVQRKSHRGVQQPAGITVDKSAYLELGDVPELVTRLACREHEPYGVGQEPTRHEREGERRRTIQPLCVIEHAQQRTPLRHFGEEAQHGEADQKTIRRGSGAQAEDDPKGVALWDRETLEVIEHRRAQLVQARVGQLHFRFNAGRARDVQVRGGRDQILQQRSLPDPRLAPEYERTTLAPADVIDQAVQPRALVGAAEQVHTRRHPRNRLSTGGNAGKNTKQASQARLRVASRQRHRDPRRVRHYLAVSQSTSMSAGSAAESRRSQFRGPCRPTRCART